MKKELLNWLRCPKCNGNLKLNIKIIEGDEVKEGNLECRCGEEYKIIEFIPKFTESKRYVDTWEIVWKRYTDWLFNGQHDIELELMRNEAKRTFENLTNLSENNFENKLVLDVGCGFGPHADLIGRCGGIVIGADLGNRVVECAYRYTQKNKNVHIIQADVYNLPFAEKTFDIIYSIGVLCNTPNPKSAFIKLPCLLKKKGVISIWTLNDFKKRPILENGIRRCLKRSPYFIRFSFYYMLALLNDYFIRIIKKIPVLRKFVKVIYFFIHLPENTPWCPSIIHIIEDYNQEYTWFYSIKEVSIWFEDAGLSNIELGKTPISITGTKI